MNIALTMLATAPAPGPRGFGWSDMRPTFGDTGGAYRGRIRGRCAIEVEILRLITIVCRRSSAIRPIEEELPLVQKHTRRSSPHPWIDAVWQTISIEDGIYRATPDGSWDLILSYGPDGQPTLWLTGQATEPVDVPYVGGSHAVVVSFAAHAFLAREKQVLTGATVRFIPVQRGRFELGGVDLPLPTFENAEALVDEMIAAGLLESNDVVAKAFGPQPKAASKRSVQQHFKKTTGITQKAFAQIRRAQEAVRLLKSGASAAAVAADLGYTDQPHMIRSIKKIMGHLPTDLEMVHKI